MKKLPKRRDKNQISGDSKGFVYKNKSNILNKSFKDFVKFLSEVDKDNISEEAEKKIK
jgi:hypothetical protein